MFFHLSPFSFFILQSFPPSILPSSNSSLLNPQELLRKVEGQKRSSATRQGTSVQLPSCSVKRRVVLRLRQRPVTPTPPTRPSLGEGGWFSAGSPRIWSGGWRRRAARPLAGRKMKTMTRPWRTKSAPETPWHIWSDVGRGGSAWRRKRKSRASTTPRNWQNPDSKSRKRCRRIAGFEEDSHRRLTGTASSRGGTGTEWIEATASRRCWPKVRTNEQRWRGRLERGLWAICEAEEREVGDRGRGDK